MGTITFILSVDLLNQLPDTVSPNMVIKPVENAIGSVLSIVMIESAKTESAIRGFKALSLAVIETAICPSELSTSGRL